MPRPGAALSPWGLQAWLRCWPHRDPWPLSGGWFLGGAMKRPLITTRVLFNHYNFTSLSPGAPGVGAVPPSPGTSSGVGGLCRHPPCFSLGDGRRLCPPGAEERCFVPGPPTCRGGWGRGEPPVCAGMNVPSVRRIPQPARCPGRRGAAGPARKRWAWTGLVGMISLERPAIFFPSCVWFLEEAGGVSDGDGRPGQREPSGRAHLGAAARSRSSPCAAPGPCPAAPLAAPASVWFVIFFFF